MPSPFPGMDPYLERPHWADFHATFIPCWRRAINQVLPRSYSARIEVDTNLIEHDPSEVKLLQPDLAIVRNSQIATQESRESDPASIQPVICTLPNFVEVTDRWIEIIHEPDHTLVAVAQLLDPRDKGPARSMYLKKRERWIQQFVHIIELDLLLDGVRLPMREPLPDGDYYAFVSRSERRPQCDVYAWSLRDKLPCLPIPLLYGEPDVFVDLAASFAIAYEMGGYDVSIKYANPPAVPIPEIHGGWVAEVAKSVKPA